jgi:general secretion pathway protein K
MQKSLLERRSGLLPEGDATGHASPNTLLSPTVRRQNLGFALIIVLWTLVLITFVVMPMMATARTEVQIATNIVTNAVAQAAADGAVFEAIFNQSDPQPRQRWPIDGSARELVIGNSRVLVRLEDEAWWINPNSASPALLEALLRAIGSDPEGARRLAVAIGEWVGSAPLARPQDAVLEDYRAAGLDSTFALSRVRAKKIGEAVNVGPLAWPAAHL